MLSTRLIKSVFSTLVRSGSLMVVAADGRRMCFGDGSAAEVVVRFADAGGQWAMLLGRDLHIGELFSDGRLIVERGTIYDFLRLIRTNKPRTAPGPLRAIVARLQIITSPRRARGLASHLLGDDLYALFLDPDWQYSSGYFEHPRQGLADAQAAKKRRIAAKLLIGPGDRVLDVGCGWGGLACYLAQTADAASVLGISTSSDQVVGARRRAEVRGLGDQTAFAMSDLQSVTGVFERIVSVDMAETGRPSSQAAFFETCRDLLTDDGVMLLQTVGATGAHSPTDPWIAKHLFPDHQLAPLSRTISRIESAGLVVTDVEILQGHYADTVGAWRKAFMARRTLAVERFGERFTRLWEYYLSVTETQLRGDDVAVFQIQIARRADATPQTRDYLASEEARLRSREQSGAWAPQSAVLHS